MNNPLVSVIMPVYNAEKYLREAIDSILNQTYKYFEFIIINDGSTDETENIILSYTDSRINYVKNETNLQIVKTLNKGISLARGKYIARMDADDISLSERFQKQVEFMEKNNDIFVCGTWVETFGIRKKIWKYPLSHEEIKISLLFNSALAHPSVMIKKDFFKDFSYEEKYNKAEDYALWVKSINKFKFANIPYPLLKYHLHSEQTDKRIQGEITSEIRKMFLANINSNLTNSEVEDYMKITLNQYVPFSKIESLFNKLLIANKKSNFFNQSLLEDFLSLNFLTIISMNTNRCIYTFYYFYNSSMFKIKILFRLTVLKLFVKCIIGNYCEK